jgi:hypothetical protein
VYCCKCSHGKETTRHFGPDNKEKLALLRYATLKGVAAAELRSYLTNALKEKQRYSPTQLRGQFSPIDLTGIPGTLFASTLHITVLNCRLPSTNNNNHSRQNLYNLDLTIQQVSNIVRRLISLLSSGRPIDTGILRSSLNTLFNHRAFPALAPGIHPDKRSFQDSLRTARGKVQAAYKGLLAAARRAGVLGRVSGRVVRAARVSGTTRPIPRMLTHPLLGPEMERVEVGREIDVRQILRRSRELAVELNSWVALLGAGRAL